MLNKLGLSISDLLGARVLDGVQTTRGGLPAGVSKPLEDGPAPFSAGVSNFEGRIRFDRAVFGRGARVSFSSSECRFRGEEGEEVFLAPSFLSLLLLLTDFGLRSSVSFRRRLSTLSSAEAN